MAMTMEQSNNRHLGSMGFDSLPYHQSPQFSNPWTSTNAQLFGNNVPTSNNMGFDALAKQQMQRSTASALPYPSLATTTSSSLGGPVSYPGQQYTQSDLMPLSSQDLMSHQSRSYDASSYTSAPSANTLSQYTSPSSNSYMPSSYTPSTTNNNTSLSHDDSRRLSHSSPLANTIARPQPSFTTSDLDATRSMVALSQDMTTPRNIYNNERNSSTDGYGFPNPPSAHSSISSASYAPSSYYAGSVDSVSDYGSQSDLESVSSRTLPQPTATTLVGGAVNGLPVPQHMLGQFSSKVPTNQQKKHKCKVCDKRFTRPSSLQTHIYSHTGEKPYACEHEGCGRHFSVVSNLRRHRKVHKGEAVSDDESREGSWSSSER